MIWCIEDDSGIRNMMTYTLQAAGFEAQGFPDGASFFAALESTRPRLILLDIMLPGEDGLSILGRLKKSPSAREIPVIMATARGMEYDKVTGLDLGADDYLVKPFGMMEMVSRVKAVLRRAEPKPSETLRLGPLELDSDSHTVRVDGARIELTRKEYDILKLFLQHPGHVFTREQLLASVWGMDFVGETRTVDVHIGTLREKLGAPGKQIATVRGVGYRLEEAL